jgi:hypothetical protein
MSACPGMGRRAGGEPQEEAAGVSRIRLGRVLRFGSGILRGVALTGPAADLLLEEGVRVLDPMGRLLLEPAPAKAAERLAQVGAARSGTGGRDGVGGAGAAPSDRRLEYICFERRAMREENA